jgi:hypothetical protein
MVLLAEHVGEAEVDELDFVVLDQFQDVLRGHRISLGKKIWCRYLSNGRAIRWWGHNRYISWCCVQIGNTQSTNMVQLSTNDHHVGAIRSTASVRIPAGDLAYSSAAESRPSHWKTA